MRGLTRKISFYGNAKEFEKQTQICKDLIKDFAHEFIKNGIVKFSLKKNSPILLFRPFLSMDILALSNMFSEPLLKIISDSLLSALKLDPDLKVMTCILL